MGDLSADTNEKVLPNYLSKHYSPTLPEDFPKERVPCKIYPKCNFEADICEKELLRLYRCNTYQGIVMSCPDEFRSFLKCKTKRVYSIVVITERILNYMKR